MTTEQADGATKSTEKRRGRGPAKPYPTLSLQDSLVLAKTIADEGVGDDMRRLTLFDRLGRSPDSGRSRQLITVSNRYGLTKGSYQAEFITVTEVGRAVAANAPQFTKGRDQGFKCAIGQFEPFSHLYETLKSRRIPAPDILRDELEKFGLPKSDADKAAQVFLVNADYVGLIQEVSGSKRIIPIEQVIEESQTLVVETPSAPVADSPTQEDAANDLLSQEAESPGPSLHIDVQVHIDSTATSEQIDQIFASMAKHLYGKDG